MKILNANAGIVPYRGANIERQEGASSNTAPSHRSPVESNVSADVQKKADNELARYLSDVQDDVDVRRPISKQTSIGQWLELLNQSWEAPAMQAWIKAHNLVPRSMHLKGSTLTAQKIVDGKVTNVTFSPSDASGWWPVGRQAIAAAAILDPQQLGLVGNSQAVLKLETIMAFYGLNWPLSTAQADELWVGGFPVRNPQDDPMRSTEVRELASRELMDMQQDAELIKTLLGVIKDKPGVEKIDLTAISQVVIPGSSFALANKSKPQLLKNLRDHPDILPILQNRQAESTTQLRLVDGQLYIKSRGRRGEWNDVTKEVRAKKSLALLLDKAIEQAKSTMNIINSGAKADARQLLRFAGLDELPANITVSELQNVLNWKLNPLPPGSSLGSYARESLTNPQSPEYLNTEHRAKVRRTASDTQAQPTLTLFECSPQPWAGKTPEHIRANADSLITQSLTQGAGLGRCAPILSALNVAPSSVTDAASRGYRQQMILTRDLLCIDPELGLKRNHIAGYDLYSGSNSGKTLLEVRTELERHISVTKQLPINQAILMTHALLATVAPEFLVKGAGEERVGSLALVNLRVQTAMVELAAPGSSRDMSTEQITSRAFLTPVSTEHQQFQALESTGPIYDWALTQGVVTAGDDYSPAAVERALTSYNRRLDEYSDMSGDLDKARSANISRIEAAKQEFERIAPGNGDFFKKGTVYVEPHSSLYQFGKAIFEFSASVSGGGPTVVDGKRVSTAEHAAEASSLYDLYVSGVLTAENVSTRQWKFTSTEDRLKFESLKPQLSKLKPISEVFDGKFNAGVEHLEKFKLMSTRVMLSEMPYEDRVLLEFGELFIFGAAADQRPEAGDLTQEQAQQKIGPIVFAVTPWGAQCFEFLASDNSYIRRPELLENMQTLTKVDIEKHKDIVRLRKKNHPTLPVDIAIKGYMPADKRYQHGSTQVPNTYASKRTNEMIKVFKDDGMFVNRQLMLADAKGLTNLERIQQRFDAAESFIVNTIIPFKSNIEDIASGDPKRTALGALGLGLEIFGALFVVAGAVSAVAKGASIASKVGQLGKAAISMFNLPGAVVDTGKSLFRLSSVGIKSVGQVAPKTVVKGLSDFPKLVSGGHNNSQRAIGRSLKPWTAQETKDLLSNTGLINTGIGTYSYIQQPAPVQTPGSTVRV